MPSSAPSITFAEATAVKAVSSHTYSANFVDDWCIGAVPHGGVVTATFLQVASAHFSSTLSAQNQPHTIALHLDFLRRTETGPALFTVKDVKLGRQASVIHITLTQRGDREEVVGYVTNSNIDTESGVSFPTSWSLHPKPLAVDLAKLSKDEDENWARETVIPYADFRKARMKTVFHLPRRGQRVKSSADEWVKLSTGERWTNASLGYISDMWPMPVETYLHSSNPNSPNNSPDDVTQLEKSPTGRFWYPTLLLNLDIKKSLPDEGVEWLFVRVDSKKIKNGRMDIDVVILDETGDVVALSQQVSFAVDAARNFAKRNPGSKI